MAAEIRSPRPEANFHLFKLLAILILASLTATFSIDVNTLLSSELQVGGSRTGPISSVHLGVMLRSDFLASRTFPRRDGGGQVIVLR